MTDDITTDLETDQVFDLTEDVSEEIEDAPVHPWNLPGQWFVVHTQAGYEKKVSANLAARIQSMNMEDRIFDVVIPMEEVVEFKG
ncbi:MAG: transcription termination/antitermination NusG family protein, partial [Actinomycetota bacterium]